MTSRAERAAREDWIFSQIESLNNRRSAKASLKILSMKDFMYWNRITDQSTSKPLSRLHFNDYGCQKQLNANIRTHALLKPQKRTLMKLWVFPMEIRIFTRLYFSMLPLSLSGNEAISFCWKYSYKSLLCFGPCLWQSLLFVYAVLGKRWTRVLKWSSSQKQAIQMKCSSDKWLSWLLFKTTKREFCDSCSLSSPIHSFLYWSTMPWMCLDSTFIFNIITNKL